MDGPIGVGGFGISIEEFEIVWRYTMNWLVAMVRKSGL